MTGVLGVKLGTCNDWCAGVKLGTCNDWCAGGEVRHMQFE